MSKNSLIPSNLPQKLLPHVAVLITAVVILFAYFSPVTKDQILYQTDLIQHRGMAKEIQDYRKAHDGDEPLWGANMFSGMPTYQYGAQYTGHLFRPVFKVLTLGLPRPVETFFLLFLGFYILLLSLKIDPWLSGIGAMAFMFSSFFFVSIEAGHTSKIYAVAFMAIVVAGVNLAYQGKRYLGLALTTLGMGLEITVNHFQITYYLMFILAFLVIGRAIHDFRAGKIKEFAITSAFLLAALGLGIGANYGKIKTTAEYANETIRGPVILKNKEKTVQENQIFKAKKENGLKPNYAFQWSNGASDLFTFLTPYAVGGASGDNIGEGSETYEIFKRNYGKRVADAVVGQYPTYWGELPFTSGPVYAGAIVLFLFVLGLLIVDNKYRWWILGITILALLLSMGKHFLPLSKLFFNYFPMYNKFRAPSMMLIVVEFTLPLLGFLALRKFMKEGWTTEQKEKLKKRLFIAAGATAGLLLVLVAMGGSLFSFSAPGDEQSIGRIVSQVSQQPNPALVSELSDALVSDRIALFRTDALRSVLFILLGGGLLFAFIQNYIKKPVVYAGLALLIGVDMWFVNKRYLNDENFVKETKITQLLRAKPADTNIKQDRDPHFRVFNITSNIFQEAFTSYHHKSIGGYHAAKLRRYQDLIENYLEKYPSQIIQALNGAIQANKNPIEALNAALAKMGPLNMLNCKYIIANPDQPPLVNPNRLGNAWFVDNIKVVAGPDEEMQALGSIDPAKTAVVSGEKMIAKIQGFDPTLNPANKISLTSFDQKKMVYSSNAQTEQFAVFSEVYYNSGKGWQAYVDGNPADHIRVNYLLRGMRIPAGQHTVEFRFEPSSYYGGNTLSLVFSLLSFIAIGGCVYLALKKGEWDKEEDDDAGGNDSKATKDV